jgi:hypothetical protein
MQSQSDILSVIGGDGDSTQNQSPLKVTQKIRSKQVAFVATPPSEGLEKMLEKQFTNLGNTLVSVSFFTAIEKYACSSCNGTRSS